MAVISVLLRVLFLLLVVRLIGRFLVSLLRPARSAAPQAAKLVRDRVCNTFLPRERSLVARVAGHEEYFCSTACRDRALADARA